MSPVCSIFQREFWKAGALKKTIKLGTEPQSCREEHRAAIPETWYEVQESQVLGRTQRRYQ